MRKFYLSSLFLCFAITALAEAPALSGFNSKAPVEVTADSLEVLQKDQLAMFTGNVVAKQADIEIKSNQMKVYYGGSAATSGASQKITKIEVIGNVLIRTKGESAQGGKGVYDVTSGIVTLTGNVSLTKAGNIIKGDSLFIDLNKGTSKIANSASGGQNGRVRGLFTPQE